MEGFKICPYCGGENYRKASRCRHCKEWFLENDFVDNNFIENDTELNLFQKNLYGLLKWLYENEDARNVFLGLLIVLIFCAYISLKPYTLTAYVKDNNSKICHKADSSTCYKKTKILEPIELYPKNFKKKGFLKTKQGEYIKETSITYKDTEEYKQIKNKLEIAKEEKEKKEAEAKKTTLTAQERKFVEDELANWENGTGKIFEYHENVQEVFNYYYINPQVWYSLDYKEKQNLLSDCMSISTIKAILKDKNYDKSQANSYRLLYSVGTRIKDANDGQSLAGMEKGEIFIK